MPLNSNPLGALPSRFRRPRWLVVGCGDVGLRVVRVVQTGAGLQRARVLALTSSPDRIPELRQAGVTPLLANLDHPATLRRLAGIATHVLHLAPPARSTSERAAAPTLERDGRTRHLLQALQRARAPLRFVYASTSGVYGDCAGALVAETRPALPQTPRAQRRLDAEQAVRHWGRATGCWVSVLRIPGIYAADRAGGTPQARLLAGTPVLAAADDVYTNHIHANDLALACCCALWRARPQRLYNIADQEHFKMGDYFDMAADHYGLPHPPRIPRQQAHEHISPMSLSFMDESRRLDNQRMLHELGVHLRYPSVRQGL